jgi:hypothetical protein
MISLAVDDNYDIYMDSSRNIGTVFNKAAVQQDCLLASQMLYGEYPYNTNLGVKYFQALFQNKNPYEFEQSMIENLESVPNVKAVRSFQMIQLADGLQYAASIDTTYGEVSL